LNPTISTIIPVRNRSGVRLLNCLGSLRWQDVDTDHEIIISDFGSDLPHSQSIDQVAEELDVRIVRTATDETWNRSRALNIGIQAAAGDYVFCTDADMIFQPNFVSTLLATHREASKDVMIHCRCHDLPEDVPEKEWAARDFEELRSQATVRAVRGTGACQSATREFFERVRGYDEKFKYWGAEDVDMTARAERFGLDIHWVSNATSMLHQWHPTMKHDRRLLWRVNRWRYRLTKHIIVKNRSGWGTLP